jgi:D-arabinitol dehydrogenase (NADP+)
MRRRPLLHQGGTNVKAIVYNGPRDYAFREVPTPEPQPDELRIKVQLTGICGTDLHIHEGNFSAEFPLIPGHELVGTVDAIGDSVTGFALGQSVSVNPNDYCGVCEYCARGQALMCVNLKGMGTNWAGSFAEYLVAPARLCFAVDGLDPEVAVFTEPTSCATHGLETLGAFPGADALVFGAGPTGLLLAQLIAHGGASRVTVAASSEFKLDRAKALGIDRTLLMDRNDLDASVAALHDLSPSGFGVVVDATGSAAVSERCVSLTRRRGTVMFYGVTGPDDLVKVSPFDIFRREITIKGSFAEIFSFPAAIDALRNGRARTEGLITHRFALADYDKALEALQSDRSVHKIVLVP